MLRSDQINQFFNRFLSRMSFMTNDKYLLSYKGLTNDELSLKYVELESITERSEKLTIGIVSSIYSTNLIESLNKEIKRQCKKKVVFPNEESLERYLVAIFEDYNFRFENRIHKGFGVCSDTLDSLSD